MISYPGEILARFDRYEAVEDLGRFGKTRLWRAWDPFLDRFVVIVGLDELDNQAVHRGLDRLDSALAEWTGGDLARLGAVLDCSPGTETPAFLVCAPKEAESLRSQASPADPTPRIPPSAGETVARAAEPLRPPPPLAGQPPPPQARATRGNEALESPPPPPAVAPPPRRDTPPLQARAGTNWAGLLAAAVAGLTLLGVAARYLTRDEPPAERRPTAPPQVAARERPLPGAPENAARRNPPPVGAADPTATASEQAAVVTSTPPLEASATPRSTPPPTSPPTPPVAAAAATPTAAPPTVARESPPETRPAGLRGEPSSDSVTLAADDARGFAAIVSGVPDPRYAWFLNGRAVAQTARYQLKGADLAMDRKNRLEALVSNAAGHRVGSLEWTIAVGPPRAAANAVEIDVPEEIAVGTTLKVKGRVRLQGRYNCAWYVGTEWQTGVCEGFEWNVPATQTAPVKVVLKVTDAFDRVTTKNAGVRIRAGGSAAQPPTHPVAAAPAATVETPRLPKAAAPTPAAASAAPGAATSAPPPAGPPSRDVARRAVIAYLRQHFAQKGRTPEIDFEAAAEPEPSGDHYATAGTLVVDGERSGRKRFELRRQGAHWAVSESNQ